MRPFFSKLFKRQLTLPEKWKLMRIKDTPLLSIDLELTSLDTTVAKITSIGWVRGENQSIDLSSAFYTVIRASGDLKQSPVIHGLTARDLLKGEHVKSVIGQLQAFASSHVWVLHNASLDMQVLDKVANNLKIPEFKITTVDTMLLELYFLSKTQDMLKQDAVTLQSCRHRHGLPEAPNHNALDDALATLGLGFAQWYQFDKQSSALLSDLLHTKSVKVYSIGKT
ncbi:MAG: DNA polymerase-3 subunit epsilon [Glaciecola sp.]|jgi:DNA polymerase-3 subunit epsilon